MKVFLIFFSLCLLAIFFPKITYSHAGIPFILVNNTATVQNQVYGTSNNFRVTNELAPANFIVGESIGFQIDSNLVPLAADQLKTTEFIWEFGDGQKTSGMNVKHTYTKARSYFLILKIKNPNYDLNEIEFESLQINILPNKNYTPPQAIIKVNGKEVTEPLKNPVSIRPGENIELDASASKGRIKSFKWDFGDGSKSESGAKVRHKFSFQEPYIYSIFPIVRVEDENGLLSDASIQISNQADNSSGSTQTSGESFRGWLGFALVGIAVLIFLLLGFLFFRSKIKPINSD